MIGALLRKELRQLFPLIVGLAALVLWSIADQAILKSPDTFNWAVHSWVTSQGNGEAEALFELVVGLLIAYSLLPGEHDQRTIELLYTLPVRRRTVFAVKYLAGCGILMALDMVGTAVWTLSHHLNPGSFERQLPLATIVPLHLGADLALPLVVVAYGMLLSFFRRLAWILFALVWIALEVAERIWAPLRILSVRTLMVVEHDGTTPLVDWRAWLLHGAMAAAALLLAGRLWLGRQERFAAFYARLRGSVAPRRVMVVLAMIAIALALAALAGAPFDAEDARAPAAPTPDRVQRFETERFQFTYRASLSARAMPVIHASDEAYARVRQWLGAPDLQRIVADLTDESSEHVGVAGWKKLRLDLRPPRSDSLLIHALYHETTHVFSAALSEGTSRARQAEARFFDEGLAEYVSYELLGDRRAEQEDREGTRRIGALARRRYRLRFEDLLDPKAFVRRHDEFLLYALGEVWVAALVDACGHDAPSRLLRSFARADTSQTITGLDLWRQSLQLERCDLDRVSGLYEQRLRRVERDTAGIPIATARYLGDDGGDLVFEVRIDAGTPGRFHTTLRVRADADAEADETRVGEASVEAGVPGHIRVTPPDRLGRRLEFQVGAHVRSDAPAFFTRWQSTTRTAANADPR